MLKKRLAMVMVAGMMVSTLAAGCGSGTSAPTADEMGTGTSLADEGMLGYLVTDAAQDTLEQMEADEAKEKAEAEEQAKKEAEEKAKIEEQAKKETEEKAKIDEQAKVEAAKAAANTGNKSANTKTNATMEPKQTQIAPKQQQPTPTQVQPAHEHVWTEHYATKQEWVPHVVTIDDYEPQQVVVANHWHCNCGAVVPEGSVAEHRQMHVNAGEDDGGSNVPIYETQWVRVGSHEEDTGHFEDVSYVDYYECSCGATKQP